MHMPFSSRISNPFSPRSGEISFVSNPLRFDHFARAAGNFFNIYRRLFSFKKSHKGHGKTNQCTSLSGILIGFLTHLARAAGKFFKCICLFLLGCLTHLARATGKFHSYIFVSNPLRFDHFARAAGKFFNI